MAGPWRGSIGTVGLPFNFNVVYSTPRHKFEWVTQESGYQVPVIRTYLLPIPKNTNDNQVKALRSLTCG